MSCADARRVRDLVGGDALDQLRQLEPVAALQRQLLHLRRVHVARDLRRRRIDERRFARHGHRLAERRQLHREREGLRSARPAARGSARSRSRSPADPPAPCICRAGCSGGGIHPARRRRRRSDPPVARLVAVTVAPGSTAFVSSVTRSGDRGILSERRRAGHAQHERDRERHPCDAGHGQSLHGKQTVTRSQCSFLRSAFGAADGAVPDGSANAASVACVDRPVADQHELAARTRLIGHRRARGFAQSARSTHPSRSPCRSRGARCRRRR